MKLLKSPLRTTFLSSGSRFYSSFPGSTVSGFDGAVGKTPLIYLPSVSEQIGRKILAKAEFMNPGGSVKDRAALFIVRDAEEKHLIKPGGTVVEGTAGNTGIGMAHICRARGYKCRIYMPNTQAKEKIDLLKALGAEVIPVPAVPFSDPNNYNHQAARYAQETENCVWGNQFDNIANRYGHFTTTGPEIFSQTDRTIDAFTCATGTGGTLGGVSMFLKQKKDVKIVLADPPGSVLYSLFKTGKPERTGTGSITEGIGQGRVTSNLEGIEIDDAVHIPDSESIKMVFKLLAEEGLFVGASSALNVAAAVEVAKNMPEGSTVVTVLCDGAYRYQSRLFNKKWLEEKNLLQHVDPQFHDFLS